MRVIDKTSLIFVTKLFRSACIMRASEVMSIFDDLDLLVT